MNYQQAKEYIQSIQSGAKIKPGLEVIGNLLELLGNPQDGLTFIHVAGTNGKGSTASLISSVLAEGGLKVGRYVSPAVFSEFEKIRWMKSRQTVYISETEFVEIMEEIRKAIDSMKEHGLSLPTEFEIETAAAFLAFYRWNCDIVVLETGMGGRLDATNVVKNVQCAVITPIALDHMKFLGDTVEEIAMEKAGIIKKHVPCVSYQKDERAWQCLAQVCARQKSEIGSVEEKEVNIIRTSRRGSVFDYKQYKEIVLPLAGIYQIQNACLALECIDRLREHYGLTTEQMKKGIENTKWPGRFETINEDPVVVVDGAHNPDGMISFCDSVNTYFNDYKKIGIMGVFADKDHATMSRSVFPVFDKIYTVTPPSERGLAAEELAEELREQAGKEGKMFPVHSCGSIQEALGKAAGDCQKDKTAIFVFGSLSLLKETYEYFR